MSLLPTRYQRKPFYVQAVQVTADNLEEVAEWCAGQIRHTKPNPAENVPSAPYVKVCVLNPRSERLTRAYVGDWVVRAGSGFKIYPDKSFNESFIRATPVVKNDNNYGAHLDH